MDGSIGQWQEQTANALTISKTDHFQVWALRITNEISGRPLNTIKLIAVDGKLSEEYIRREILSEHKTEHHTTYVIIILFLTTFANLSKALSPDCLIVRDYYHLKNSIWPKQLRDTLYNQIKAHPESALNSKEKKNMISTWGRLTRPLLRILIIQHALPRLVHTLKVMLY